MSNDMKKKSGFTQTSLTDIARVFEEGTVKTYDGTAIEGKYAWRTIQTLQTLINDGNTAALDDLKIAKVNSRLHDTTYDALGSGISTILGFEDERLLLQAKEVIQDTLHKSPKTGKYELKAGHYTDQFEDLASEVGAHVSFDKNYAPRLIGVGKIDDPEQEAETIPFSPKGTENE